MRYMDYARLQMLCSVIWYMHHIEVFLGVFEKSRKATINFFVSVRPSIRVKQLCCHWIFMKFE
jgi:hypothetical protein